MYTFVLEWTPVLENAAKAEKHEDEKFGNEARMR